MLIPSIDLMGGRIVQLERGRELKLAFDEFDPWIERFAYYPMVQLIDLDAAMQQGDNRGLVEAIAQKLPCQVGGGIGSIERAKEMLSAGARRVIVGSALFDVPDTDSTRPRVRTDFAGDIAEAVGEEKLIFSVDAFHDRIAIRGWKHTIDLAPGEAMATLEPYCSAFLYTHIDREGTMQGFPIEIARKLRSRTKRQLIVAGGIRERNEIEVLDGMGIDTVAGMALYLGYLD